ncbi:MAG: hypothetical protein R3199_04170 [Gemmatimonadota bacterium]|nr:hypothetical protein [Gemmatimonadota bacterium]
MKRMLASSLLVAGFALGAAPPAEAQSQPDRDDALEARLYGIAGDAFLSVYLNRPAYAAVFVVGHNGVGAVFPWHADDARRLPAGLTAVHPRPGRSSLPVGLQPMGCVFDPDPAYLLLVASDRPLQLSRFEDEIAFSMGLPAIFGHRLAFGAPIGVVDRLVTRLFAGTGAQWSMDTLPLWIFQPDRRVAPRRALLARISFEDDPRAYWAEKARQRPPGGEGGDADPESGAEREEAIEIVIDEGPAPVRIAPPRELEPPSERRWDRSGAAAGAVRDARAARAPDRVSAPAAAGDAPRGGSVRGSDSRAEPHR